MFNIKNMLLAITVICGLSIGTLYTVIYPCGNSELQQTKPASYVIDETGKRVLFDPTVPDEDKKYWKEIRKQNEFATATNPRRKCLEKTMEFIEIAKGLSDDKKKDINFSEHIGETRYNSYTYTISMRIHCSLPNETLKRLLGDRILPSEYRTRSQFECDSHQLTFAITYLSRSAALLESFDLPDLEASLNPSGPYEAWSIQIYYATLEEVLEQPKEYLHQRNIYYINIRIREDDKQSCSEDDKQSCSKSIPNLRAVPKSFAAGDTEFRTTSVPLNSKQIYKMIACPLLHLGQQ